MTPKRSNFLQHQEIRNYGFNLIIKDFAKFPRYLPLPAHLAHGWNPLPKPLNTDLATAKPLMLVFSQRRLEAWQSNSTIPAAIMGSPFILYKDSNKIKKSANATGTIAFPSHSTFDLKSEFNIDEYCRELSKLPGEFQPITICLFYLDYISPKSQVYRKYGFRVVTVGPEFTNSIKFVRNFYKLLRDHRFATSNKVGTYTFYAVNLEIPFFLAGETPMLLNENLSDKNISTKILVERSIVGRNATKLFSTGPVRAISAEQYQFVDAEMGVNDHLSSEALRRLLWQKFRDNNYWLRAVLPYWINSILTLLVFNSPITPFLIRLRHKQRRIKPTK